jgi:hypothetical protein
MSDTHVMNLVSAAEDGETEWHCQLCGRRILIAVNPVKVTVLEPGNTGATHTGSAFPGFDITSARLVNSIEEDLERALKEAGFNDLWKEDANE